MATNSPSNEHLQEFGKTTTFTCMLFHYKGEKRMQITGEKKYPLLRERGDGKRVGGRFEKWKIFYDMVLELVLEFLEITRYTMHYFI